jgi:hypothetical protein
LLCFWQARRCAPCFSLPRSFSRFVFFLVCILILFTYVFPRTQLESSGSSPVHFWSMVRNDEGRSSRTEREIFLKGQDCRSPAATIPRLSNCPSLHFNLPPFLPKRSRKGVPQALTAPLRAPHFGTNRSKFFTTPEKVRERAENTQKPPFWRSRKGATFLPKHKGKIQSAENAFHAQSRESFSSCHNSVCFSFSPLLSTSSPANYGLCFALDVCMCMLISNVNR